MRHDCSRLGGLGLAAALVAVTAVPAFAHATLEPNQAVTDSYFRVDLGVPHGCDGSATVKIRVQIPEGVIAVKPMPKPGWTLEIVKGKYAASYDYYGTPTSEGVKEGSWSGARLP